MLETKPNIPGDTMYLSWWKTNKQKSSNTYLYCEIAIGCRFFQAEVVEFSDDE